MPPYYNFLHRLSALTCLFIFIRLAGSMHAENNNDNNISVSDISYNHNLFWNESMGEVSLCVGVENSYSNILFQV